MNRRTFLAATTSLATLTVLKLPAHPMIEFSVPLPVPSSESLDRYHLLDCLAQVESGRNDAAVSTRLGRPVARGRYQIKEATWFQHTNRPWKLAHNFSFATIVAERHLAWLEKNGCHNVFFLAHAWRYGLNAGYERGNDYPFRVQALYYDRT